MKVLVYEHISGGGLAGRTIPADLLCEGYAMLAAVVKDFKGMDSSVTCLLDHRIFRFKPPLRADKIIPVFSGEPAADLLNESLGDADAVLVIAPEADGTLEGLVAAVDASGKSLNSSPRSVREVSDKASLYGSLRGSGFAVPETRGMNLSDGVDSALQAAEELGFPLVFKPARGVGCKGLSLVSRVSQVQRAFDKVLRASPHGRYLVQRFVEGVHASVSLVCSGDEAAPLALSAQEVSLAPPASRSRYAGGVTPLEHPLRREAFTVAADAVENARGLRGYVGVDMVLSAEGPAIMEINPRLTTSYLGLRMVIDTNPAKLIKEAVMTGRMPRTPRTSGYTYFSKTRAPRMGVERLRRAYAFDAVLAPPFPLAGRPWALIGVHSTTPTGARAGFAKARRRLERLLGGGS